jgi:hypothetical protein
MRYRIALLVAVLIIAAGGLFAWLTNRQFEAELRRTFLQEQQAGRLPPALQQADVDSVDFRDFNVRVSPGQQVRLDLARLLAVRWYAWVPAVVVFCLACAAFAGWVRGRGD